MNQQTQSDLETLNLLWEEAHCIQDILNDSLDAVMRPYYQSELARVQKEIDKLLPF